MIFEFFIYRCLTVETSGLEPENCQKKADLILITIPCSSAAVGCAVATFDLTVAVNIRKKDEKMHIYAIFNPKNELILVQNWEFDRK